MVSGAALGHENFVAERIESRQYRRDNFFDDGRLNRRLSELRSQTVARLEIGASVRHARARRRKFFAALHKSFNLGGNKP